MTKEQVEAELNKSRQIDTKYMIGTKAYHILGEISSNVEDIFWASEETDDYWIGAWVTGLGFVSVCFPKETSRELTDQERKEYARNTYTLAGNNFKLEGL